MECVTCDTILLHIHHEPMSMGCSCATRVCRRCVLFGEVISCPTCRKVKRKPTIDKTFLHDLAQQTSTTPCLGCKHAISNDSLQRHEKECQRYRTYLEGMNREDLKTYQTIAKRCQADKAELNERIDLQADTIADLEEELNHTDAVIQTHELERQLYVAEQRTIIKTLQSIHRPLDTLTRRIQDLQNKIQNLRSTVIASGQIHQTVTRKRRRLDNLGEIITALTGSDPDEPPASPARDQASPLRPPSLSPSPSPSPQLSSV